MSINYTVCTKNSKYVYNLVTIIECIENIQYNYMYVTLYFIGLMLAI